MLDSLDKKIIVELDKNARRPFSQLAKKVKTSKNVVSYRVSQLRKKNIIRGYYAVVDTMKLGYHNYRLYLRLMNVDAKRKEDIIQMLIEEPGTWWVASTTRPWDVAIILLAQSINEADEKVRSILRRCPGEMSDYKLSRYVKLVHFPKDYLTKQDLVEKRHAFAMHGEKAVGISDMERRILVELSLDARAGTVKLARKLKTTPAIVKYAIKKLARAGVILGFRVLIDYEKIGHDYHWIHVDMSDSSEELADYVRAFPNTAYYSESLGGYSVEFAVHLKKEDDMHAFMERVLEKFGSLIRDYSYFRVVKNHKVVYMPQRM